MSYQPYVTTSSSEKFENGVKYYIKNTNIVDNKHYNTVENTWFDDIKNDGAFKINVMGKVGSGTTISLQNLIANRPPTYDMVRPPRFDRRVTPNGQFIFLI